MRSSLRHIALVSALVALWVGGASASDCVETKPIAFDTFMRGAISASVPLKVAVPSNYRHADLAEIGSTYSYWMMPGAAKRAKRSGDLPASGYLYGKVSMDVAYDAERDLFVDGDGGDIRQQLAGEGAIAVEQTRIRGHTLLFLEVSPEPNARKVYAVYLALNRATNAVYLAYRPPVGDAAAGDCFWKMFKATMMAE
ncbi:MAG: hypothetical protein IT473_15990 [Lysobacter sp.]|nr:hypothetical protein [Lysobacter sp.]